MNFHIAFCVPHAAAARRTGNRGEKSAVKIWSKQVNKKGGKAKIRFASLFICRLQQAPQRKKQPAGYCKASCPAKARAFTQRRRLFSRGEAPPHGQSAPPLNRNIFGADGSCFRRRYDVRSGRFRADEAAFGRRWGRRGQIAFSVGTERPKRAFNHAYRAGVARGWLTSARRRCIMCT